MTAIYQWQPGRVQLTALIFLSASSLLTLTNATRYHQDHILKGAIAKRNPAIPHPVFLPPLVSCKSMVSKSCASFIPRFWQPLRNWRMLSCCKDRQKIVAFFISASLGGSKPKQFSRSLNNYLCSSKEKNFFYLTHQISNWWFWLVNSSDKSRINLFHQSVGLLQ